MIRLTIEEPTLVRIESDKDLPLLAAQLTYVDRKVQYQIKNFKKASWFIFKNGQLAYDKELARLEKLQKVCLLKKDDRGWYTYSGLVEYIKSLYTDVEVINKLVYPESGLVAWERKLEVELRYYQKEAIERLLEIKHGTAVIGTGGGKTQVILYLAKKLGLKTVIAAPTVSIASQIYDLFVHSFGKHRVGKFFDSKKQSNKLFTVAVTASLTRIKEDDDHYNNLKDTKVLIMDENHLSPAETVSKVCLELLKETPYRFHLTATNERNDGSDLLLKAIGSSTVIEKNYSELCQEGFLSPLFIKIIKAESDSMREFKGDANKTTREHFYNNSSVNKMAANIADNCVSVLNRKVLILIDEVEQFNNLLPFFKHGVSFAHSGNISESAKKKIPKEFHKSDAQDLVNKFNDNKIDILIGTSAIGLGTDLKPVGALIYLVGGKSRVQIKQGVGRGTRLAPGKTDCIIFDFDITNNQTLHRHLLARLEVYKELTKDIDFIDSF